MAKFRFDHLALYVSDAEVSGSFYQQLFALERIPDPFPKGKAWFSLGDRLQLHLISDEGGRNSIPERSHICFSTSDLDSLLNRLREKGISWSDFDGNTGSVRIRPDGIRQIYFQDPDGYWIEVNDSGG